VGMLLLGLLALPIALAVKMGSKGPVMFSQERVGRGGRTFRIYKFRTLPVTEGGPRNQTIWERKVTRPTRVGRWLRKLRLDEMPQFWNVVKGDMSLVGPRPFVPDDVEELQRHIPFFRARHLVRPGLTGWAQIRAKYGTTLEDEMAKLQYDLYYIRHQSLAFDLAILIKTIAVLLRLAGR
jgi:lipopolysaccharide/colanic/teichoic acid biosynthesis glycosyltransferase